MTQIPAHWAERLISFGTRDSDSGHRTDVLSGAERIRLSPGRPEAARDSVADDRRIDAAEIARLVTKPEFHQGTKILVARDGRNSGPAE